jgi:hypothetical protein
MPAGNQMDDRFWIRMLPWRLKNNPESKSAQIKFAPELRIFRDDGWAYLELLLVNRSSWNVWVEEASVVLADLDANWQTALSTGQARHPICQNVGPDDELRVSLAGAIYDAAGRPQGKYSSLVLTNVRYRVLDEWCNARLNTYRVEMAALTVFSLRSTRWYDKKGKQIDGPVGLTPKEDKS